MLTMDVFNTSAFSAIEMTGALDKFNYVPDFLGTIPDLFVPVPVRTEVIWIEERSYAPTILQTTPRGSAPHNTGGDRAVARAFKTVRLADASRITASELQNIREFGSDSELKQLAKELGRRQQKMMQNMQLTKEALMLSTVQGTTTDKDGTTIYAWDTQFSQTIPAEVDFDLDNASPASGILRQRCTTAVRSIRSALKGVGNPTRIVALCGDTFWDQLIAHSEVRATYLNWQAATDLRKDVAWDAFTFAGIDFVNYRSTDSDAGATDTVSVGATKCKMFPVGAGIFQWAMSPGESFDFANTPGQEFYSSIVRDLARNTYVDVELYSYPLPVCTMPSALYRARNT